MCDHPLRIVTVEELQALTWVGPMTAKVGRAIIRHQILLYNDCGDAECCQEVGLSIALLCISTTLHVHGVCLSFMRPGRRLPDRFFAPRHLAVNLLQARSLGQICVAQRCA